MDWEGLEISQAEHDEFVSSWDLVKLREDIPSSYQSVIRGIKNRILDARQEARVSRMVTCLSKWCWVAMGILGGKTEPDLTRPLPTKEDVDGFKIRVKNFFKNELYHSDGVKPYWLEQGIDQLPPWDNLNEASWLAFYLEWRKL